MTEKRLLLHICCGPCATYPFEVLREDFSVTGFFYNPNIHPFREFQRRKKSTQEAANYFGLDLKIKSNYPLEGFLATAGSVAPQRCQTCYRIRLGMTAKEARRGNFDGFSTTLLTSPYQDFEGLIQAGREAGNAWGVDFFALDFRKGFSRSRDLARELKLYRQGYCGCIFSEKERYFRR